MQEIVRIESPCPQEKSKVTGQVQRDGARDRSGRCKYCHGDMLTTKGCHGDISISVMSSKDVNQEVLSWRHVNREVLSWRHVNQEVLSWRQIYKGKMWMCHVDLCFKSQVHSKFTDSF